MHFSWLIIINLVAFPYLQERPKDKSLFISPVRIPLLLSANFGELRSDHFHSGIDIKTQGTTGKEIVAAAEGYVSRISVSPSGFGKALYITHPSGFSTVYGHLDGFIPEIEEYVKQEQYEKKSFLITLFPPRDKFRFSQGQLVAYSGNSGSSGGPHLHYEIRRTDGERPVNPLFFDFGTRDDIKPVIEKLAIYPVNRYTEVNGNNAVRKFNVSGGHGNYYIPAENEIRISGMAGFGIKTFDLLNDSYNKCSVYSIELAVDSIVLYKYLMDSFSFSESRYINAHIDYETYVRDGYFIHRTFRQPNDRLSVYKELINRGIVNFKDEEIHHVRITVTDVHNNKSTLAFRIRSVMPSQGRKVMPPDDKVRVMPFARSNRFETDDVSLSIPAGALYDTLFFEYERSPLMEGMLSDVHRLHDRYTPLHRSVRLAIKPQKVPAGMESKMLIAQIADENRKVAVNSTWTGGMVEADVSTLGSYFITIDTIAPRIEPSGFSSGANLSGKKSIRFRISDDLSGIRSYEPEIDGKWYLFEYDAKNNVLICEFDEKRLSRGAKHNLSLKVSDSRNNTSTYNCTFTW